MNNINKYFRNTGQRTINNTRTQSIRRSSSVLRPYFLILGKISQLRRIRWSRCMCTRVLHCLNHLYRTWKCFLSAIFHYFSDNDFGMPGMQFLTLLSASSGIRRKVTRAPQSLRWPRGRAQEALGTRLCLTMNRHACMYGIRFEMGI